MLYFVINMDAKGEYYWMLLDENDQVIGKSISSYKEFSYCEDRIKTIMIKGPYDNIIYDDLNQFNDLLKEYCFAKMEEVAP